MSRYIDADKLVQDLNEFYANADCRWQRGRDTGLGINIAKQIIENQPTADAQEVVRCKDCVYWQSKKVQMNDGTLRDYTPEEINEGCVVDMSKGINLGSRCTRGQLEDDNVITFWCNENDFCNFGAKIDKGEQE